MSFLPTALKTTCKFAIQYYQNIPKNRQKNENPKIPDLTINL